eukprot:247310-Ditylum_brightwellii.AAC.1
MSMSAICGDREALQSFVGKAILFICGDAVTKACGAKQLCVGLRLGIEGRIHAMDDLWSDYGDNKEWGILLVDARNVFNKLNCMALLWHVRHLWPAGSRNSFNTYQHWKILVFHCSENLHSKEGMTQGNPLAMILYVLG